MKSKLLFIPIFIITALILVQCASEAVPGGGPPDKTPPILIETNVLTGSTLVPEDLEIILNFSENLNPDMKDKSVTIFPLRENTATVRIKGKKLVITPNERWEPEQVYTLILSKSISDMRGNTLKEPLQFSFTSGKNMPTNLIKGKILDLKPNSTAVIAISRLYEKPDSILMFPEYYTQSGPEGDFLFEFLPAEEFNIAAYVDMDKSNSYKVSFDGACVPSRTSILPDTAGPVILMEAFYDNFEPGRLLSSKSISPSRTELTFQKEPAPWSTADRFKIQAAPPDSLIIEDKTCILFHPVYEPDSVNVAFSGLQDHLGVSIQDSSFNIRTKSYEDSLYLFYTLGQHLLISPPISEASLSGEFLTSSDTLNLTLELTKRGFYELPRGKSNLRGTWKIRIPQNAGPAHMNTDTTYSVALELKPKPEYGSVFGFVESSLTDLRIVLFNKNHNYEHLVINEKIKFEQVQAGTYSLAYYVDRNENGRRDSGNPYPFIKPEFLYMLDTDISVRERWDTELEEPYKIVVENN